MALVLRPLISMPLSRFMNKLKPGTIAKINKFKQPFMQMVRHCLDIYEIFVKNSYGLIFRIRTCPSSTVLTFVSFIHLRRTSASTLRRPRLLVFLMNTCS